MPMLKTTYMGLSLSSPVVVAASALSGKIENIQKAEEAGAGALVIRSLFEEQIARERGELEDIVGTGGDMFAESLSYFPHIQHSEAREHLMWVEKTRKAVKFPLIASLNAVTPGKWVDYARQLAETGVDGLELNVYAVETDITRDANAVEDSVVAVLDGVRNATRLPIAVKLSPFYTSVGNVVARLETHGASAVVLFNRFLQPEIDPVHERLRHTAGLSTAGELRLPLRWVALLHGRVGLDLAGNTGIHTGADVAKFILAGASVTQVAATLFRNGVGYVATLNQELTTWLQGKGYANLDACRGKLSLGKYKGNAFVLERAHYLDYVAGHATTA